MSDEDLKAVSKTIKMVLLRRKGRTGLESHDREWLAGCNAIHTVLNTAAVWRQPAEFQEELARMIYVRSTAILEAVVRGVVCDEINDASKAGSLPRRVISQLSRQQFTISDIYDVPQRGIGLGELATASSSFRDPETAMGYASRLIYGDKEGKTFAKRLREYSFDEGSDAARDGESALKSIGAIEAGIQVRHHASHAVATNERRTLREANEYFADVLRFTNVFSVFFEVEFAEMLKREAKDK